MEKRAKNINILAWLLSLCVCVVAIIAWGQGLHWRLVNLSGYAIFPLFGLLAFSLMWAHYIVAAFKKHFGISKDSTVAYFEITSLIVLIAIILHPALLWWRLWSDNFGLPPGSYKYYVGQGMVWIVMVGFVSLLIFLAYELRRIYSDRKWWRFVQYASDGAMLAILYHSLRLGSNLQRGWPRGLWYFYGFTYVLSLIYLYGFKTKRPK